mmetsp:Transcript_84418/g.235504  ORF Transcript_84418/g.235504 Transcript_84418/m.235504 type:complete len:311 (+) Transcript_84418:147-1079(+)
MPATQRARTVLWMCLQRYDTNSFKNIRHAVVGKVRTSARNAPRRRHPRGLSKLPPAAVVRQQRLLLMLRGALRGALHGPKQPGRPPRAPTHAPRSDDLAFRRHTSRWRAVSRVPRSTRARSRQDRRPPADSLRAAAGSWRPRLQERRCVGGTSRPRLGQHGAARPSPRPGLLRRRGNKTRWNRGGRGCFWNAWLAPSILAAVHPFLEVPQWPTPNALTAGGPAAPSRHVSAPNWQHAREVHQPAFRNLLDSRTATALPCARLRPCRPCGPRGATFVDPHRTCAPLGPTGRQPARRKCLLSRRCHGWEKLV